VTFNPGSIGAILAIIVLILAIVLFAIGQLPPIMAALFVLLALARLT
jgi:hypothetical protein